MRKSVFIFISIALIVVLVFVFFGDKKTQGEKVEKDEEITISEKNHMNYRITIKTNKGDIEFKTYTEEAPNTVKNFVDLAKNGFYDGVIFHRVVDGFMIQGGDPTGTGKGGPGYVFDDEIDLNLKIYEEGYKKGVVAMANAGPNTQGSQFFIMVDDYPLPPMYTIFGKVTAGQDVADSISLMDRDVSDRPREDVIIETVSVSKEE